MRKLILSLACALALASCVSIENPQQAVFAAEAVHVAALRGAVAYRNLPRCGAGAPTLCSRPDIITALQQADNAADTAIEAAETTVRTPGFGENVYESAATAAKAAAEAFASFVAGL